MTDLKRIVVIGGAGYVGSEITKSCLDNGCRVLVFDDFSVGTTDNIPTNNSRLDIYKGSITDPDVVLAALNEFSPDLVFHLAAIHYIPDCIRRPEAVISTNIRGTLNIVSALNRLTKRPKLVFASSASVYGSTAPAPQQITALSQPCDIYGYSKMIGEHLITSNYSNYVIARLFNVFGGSDPNPHLVPSIVQQLESQIIKLGNSDTKRDFIYVKDAAHAFIALSVQGKRGHIYNVGTGISHSVEQVAKIIVSKSKSRARLAFNTTENRKADPKELRAGISDILTDTDWRPKASFEQAIETVLAPTKKPIAP